MLGFANLPMYLYSSPAPVVLLSQLHIPPGALRTVLVLPEAQGWAAFSSVLEREQWECRPCSPGVN
jgi:hypothetical protein